MKVAKRFRRLPRTGYLLWITLFCLQICSTISTDRNEGIIRFEVSLGAPAFAQEETGEEEYRPLESTPEIGTQPLEGPLHPLLREELPIEGQPLEGTIDPATYKLGPGDLLAVYIMGEVEDQILARVGADGVLRLRTLGIFNAGGRYYSDVREEVLNSAKDRYRTNEIELSLVQLRNFKASVGGMVWAPGTYNLTATDRAVTLISRAGGFYNPLSPEEEEKEEEEKREEEKTLTPELPKYSARNLKLIHRDGSIDIVDMLLFLRAGLPEGNPYLEDGDFLLIPPLDTNKGVIGVYGAVNYEGVMEYREGDNLGRALLLAGDLTPDAIRDSVQITRFTGEKDEYFTFIVNLNDENALETPLCPDDRVFVRSKQDYHTRYQVEVRGEVMEPGFYPVGKMGSTVQEIIQRAGGFTPWASLKEATITRRLGKELLDPEYERLRKTSVADMRELEYDYYRTKTREIEGQISVDFEALFLRGDSTQNVQLRDGDLIEVPPITKSIRVIGQVNKPGIQDFEEGKDYKYYIERAGGYAWNARTGKARVIKGITGKWVKPTKTIIEAGDTIFIPEKPEVDYWKIFTDGLLVVTQLATLYIVINAASK